MSESQRIKLVILATSFVLMSSVPISTVYSDIMLEFKSSPKWLLDFVTVVPGPLSIFAIALAGLLQRHIKTKWISASALVLVLFSGLMPIFLSGIWIVIMSRSLIAFGLGLLSPIITIISTQYFSGANRDKIMGYRNASQAIGSITMMIITMLLASYGWRWSFSIYLLVLPSLWILLIFLPSNIFGLQSRTNSKRQRLPKPYFLRASFFTLLSFIYLACLNTLAPSLSSFLVENKIAEGTMSGLGMCSYMLGSILGGVTFERITRQLKRYTVLLGMIVTVIGISMIAVSRGFVLILIGCFLQGVGATVFNASSIIAVLVSVNNLWKSGIIRIIMIFTSLGSFVSPFLMDFSQNIALHSNTMRGRFTIAAIILSVFSIPVLFWSYKFKSKQNVT